MTCTRHDWWAVPNGSEFPAEFVCVLCPALLKVHKPANTGKGPSERMEAYAAANRSAAARVSELEIALTRALAPCKDHAHLLDLAERDSAVPLTDEQFRDYALHLARRIEGAA